MLLPLCAGPQLHSRNSAVPLEQHPNAAIRQKIQDLNSSFELQVISSNSVSQILRRHRVYDSCVLDSFVIIFKLFLLTLQGLHFILLTIKIVSIFLFAAQQKRSTVNSQRRSRVWRRRRAVDISLSFCLTLGFFSRDSLSLLALHLFVCLWILSRSRSQRSHQPKCSHTAAVAWKQRECKSVLQCKNSRGQVLVTEAETHGVVMCLSETLWS